MRPGKARGGTAGSSGAPLDGAEHMGWGPQSALWLLTLTLLVLPSNYFFHVELEEKKKKKPAEADWREEIPRCTKPR